jgi:hypothetical protein
VRLLSTSNYWDTKAPLFIVQLKGLRSKFGEKNWVRPTMCTTIVHPKPQHVNNLSSKLGRKLFLYKIDLQVCDEWRVLFHGWRQWVVTSKDHPATENAKFIRKWRKNRVLAWFGVCMLRTGYVGPIRRVKNWIRPKGRKVNKRLTATADRKFIG